MEYAGNSLNQGLAKQQFVGGIGGQTTATPVMPTVASALGRIDHLNERLGQVASQLANIAVAVGGPFPACANAGEKLSSNGMVHRLNDSTDNAHRQVGEIEELIGSISRALG